MKFLTHFTNNHSVALRLRLIGVLGLSLAAIPAGYADDSQNQIVGPGFLPSPVQMVSTVPANGDVNPYGVAFVPNGFPGNTLNPGDILVSNFNNAQNLQGTGTTIVRIQPNGQRSVFFQGNAQQKGLSTALGILRAGFVLVGSFPSVDGTCGTASPGGLLLLDTNGNVVETITGYGINGPWDMTVIDEGKDVTAFVANGLSGTIVRLDMEFTPAGLAVQHSTEIASGYQHQCDPATFVDAPNGLVYEPFYDALIVSSTLDNAVFAVPHAAQANNSQGTGAMLYQDPAHLHGALAMAKAPNGHLLVTQNDAINGDPKQPSEIVEFTLGGQFVKQVSVDPNQGGSFGLQTATFGNNTAKLAAVDDNQNMLIIWTLPAH